VMELKEFAHADGRYDPAEPRVQERASMASLMTKPVVLVAASKQRVPLMQGTPSVSKRNAAVAERAMIECEQRVAKKGSAGEVRSFAVVWMCRHLDREHLIVWRRQHLGEAEAQRLRHVRATVRHYKMACYFRRGFPQSVGPLFATLQRARVWTIPRSLHLHCHFVACNCDRQSRL